MAGERRGSDHAAAVITTYVSLLRGINVSGHRTIGMPELRALYEALGHTDVVTYIQSGNVVSSSTNGNAADVSSAIERRIAEQLGHEVTVVIRTREQLTAILKGNPFLGAGCDPSRLHVTLTADVYDARRLAMVDEAAYDPDEYRAAGREIYLHCPAGYGNTKLNNAFWERRLGVRATTRNWNTVTKLVALARG